MIVHLLYVLSATIILTAFEINAQIYPYYNNRHYNGNYENRDAAFRPGELISQVNESPPGQTPCRNKNQKEHKDSLWWTLPIPPMEIEGDQDKEKPQQLKQQIQQAAPSATEAKTNINPGSETGAVVQPKHVPQPPPPPQIPASSTVKSVIATSAPPVLQVVTTAKHETSSAGGTGASNQAGPQQKDKPKLYQMQKQTGTGSQLQPPNQPSGQLPNPMVISNRENSNPPYTSNKSLATMRAPNSGRQGAPSHTGNKPKLYESIRMEPDRVQALYPNQPYFNSPFLQEYPMANREYRPNNVEGSLVPYSGSVAQLADNIQPDSGNNLFKDFDANDAELGGGNIVGENPAYENSNVVYDTNFALAHPEVDKWPIDPRNKRTPEGSNIRKIAVS